MTHVTEGRLRRLADEPAAGSDEEQRHIAGCARCQARAAAVEADRAFAAGALADERPAQALDVDAAWLAVQAAPADRSPRTARVGSLRARRRRRLVAAVAAGVVVVGVAGTAAASGWLPIFQPTRVQAVTFDVSSLATLPDLSAYGTVSGDRGWQATAVPGPVEAAARSGVALPTVGSLPLGVTGTPRYDVLPVRTVTFTFSAAKAAAAAAGTGKPVPPMPTGMDGARLQLQVGPGAVATWRQRSGLPVLVVARAKAPVLSSTGVSLATLERYLLAQPGIPPSLAAQLRALPADGSTLPIPVPTDVATSRATTVNGVPATLVQLRDQTESGVVWASDGTLTVVAGALSADDVLAVARGLH
jgi:hypothetical protein